MYIVRQWEFAVWLQELKQGLCDHLEGWNGEGDAKTKAQPLFVASSWPVMEIEAFPSEFNTTNGYNFFASAPGFPLIKNGQVG